MACSRHRLSRMYFRPLELPATQTNILHEEGESMPSGRRCRLPFFCWFHCQSNDWAVRAEVCVCVLVLDSLSLGVGHLEITYVMFLNLCLSVVWTALWSLKYRLTWTWIWIKNKQDKLTPSRKENKDLQSLDSVDISSLVELLLSSEEGGSDQPGHNGDRLDDKCWQVFNYTEENPQTNVLFVLQSETSRRCNDTLFLCSLSLSAGIPSNHGPVRKLIYKLACWLMSPPLPQWWLILVRRMMSVWETHITMITHRYVFHCTNKSSYQSTLCLITVLMSQFYEWMWSNACWEATLLICSACWSAGVFAVRVFKEKVTLKD